MMSIVAKLINDKANGRDNIPNAFYKHAPVYILVYLSFL